MPTEEDYGRRQQHTQHSNSAASSSVPTQQASSCGDTTVPQIQQSTTAPTTYLHGSCSVLSARINNQNGSVDSGLDSKVRYFGNQQLSGGGGIVSAHEHTQGHSHTRDKRDKYLRASSERLSSGERYHGISERYPLGERPSTSVSSERLIQTPSPQQERYQYPNQATQNQRNLDRYTPTQGTVRSLERYPCHATLDRYCRTSTPTDRFSTLSTEKDRYTTLDECQFTPSARTSDSLTFTGDRHKTNTSKSDMYNGKMGRARSSSSDRKSGEKAESSRYHQYHQCASGRYGGNLDRYIMATSVASAAEEEKYTSTTDRFAPIPCPERFATQDQNRNERLERIPSFTSIPYMEPPSPAPVSDRFVPPPPLSPVNISSPNCFPNNSFPSPTASATPPETFIPPPPLSPSPTESYTSHSPKNHRYCDDSYSSSPSHIDRYHHSEQHTMDRIQYYQTSTNSDGYPSSYHHADKYVNNAGIRYNNNERSVSANPHVPVERYIPQEPYYDNYQSHERYAKFTNSSDPYMRRDLNSHCRQPSPFPSQYHQRIRYTGAASRVKCCQYQDGQRSKSSPGSSSSSSLASCQGKDQQKEIATPQDDCQSYQTAKDCQTIKDYHCNNYQEPQCANAQCQSGGSHGTVHASTQLTIAAVTSVSVQSKEGVGYVRTYMGGQCRHNICASPSVEYVGASGGRHVCATPPPRGSISSADGSICCEKCCLRRGQNSFTVVW